MASINQSKNGLKAIQFYNATGERKTIRIGKTTIRDAEKIKTKIEELNVAKINGTPLEVETASWLATRPAKFYDKLVRVGLVEARNDASGRRSPTLGAFLEEYIAGRTDVKGGTILTYKQTQRNLIDYFGENRPLDSITPGDADQWRRWLAKHEETKNEKSIQVTLAENTVSRRCKMAKQYFRAAARRRLITESPFQDMKGCNPRGNKAREFFVTRLVAQKVIDTCPDAQWKLLFALSRFGGLRCPSEHLALRWGDVSLDTGRMTVRSAKTAHHEGKESREVPIFPELRPLLEAVFNDHENLHGRPPLQSDFVITRYRDANANLRTQLKRFLARAGVEPWPKLFQNLRSTRQTELAEDYPAHVVCNWIGNSEAVAREHYLQVTDDHFDEAIRPATPTLDPAVEKALRKALRYNAPQRSTASYPVTSNAKNTGKNAKSLPRPTKLVGLEGFEPPTKGL